MLIVTPIDIITPSICQVPVIVDSSLPGQTICARPATPGPSPAHHASRQTVHLYTGAGVGADHQRTAGVSETSTFSGVTSPAIYFTTAIGPNNCRTFFPGHYWE